MVDREKIYLAGFVMGYEKATTTQTQTLIENQMVKPVCCLHPGIKRDLRMQLLWFRSWLMVMRMI